MTSLLCCQQSFKTCKCHPQLRATYTRQYLDRGPGVCLAQVHIPRNEEGVIFSGSEQKLSQGNQTCALFLRTQMGFRVTLQGCLLFEKLVPCQLCPTTLVLVIISYTPFLSYWEYIQLVDGTDSREIPSKLVGEGKNCLFPTSWGHCSVPTGPLSPLMFRMDGGRQWPLLTSASSTLTLDVSVLKTAVAFCFLAFKIL